MCKEEGVAEMLLKDVVEAVVAQPDDNADEPPRSGDGSLEAALDLGVLLVFVAMAFLLSLPFPTAELVEQTFDELQNTLDGLSSAEDILDIILEGGTVWWPATAVLLCDDNAAVGFLDGLIVDDNPTIAA